MLSRVLPRDQSSELRELDQGQAARWLARPPERRVPVRIVRGTVAEGQRDALELALEEDGGAPLVVRARDEDRRPQTRTLHELRDVLEPDGCLEKRHAELLRDAIDEERRRERLRDAAGEFPSAVAVQEEKGEDAVRRNEVAPAVEDAQPVRVPVVRDGEIEPPRDDLFRSRPEVGRDRLGMNSAEQNVPLGSNPTRNPAFWSAQVSTMSSPTQFGQPLTFSSASVLYALNAPCATSVP